MYKVRWGAFIPALILSPLVPALPALILILVASSLEIFPGNGIVIILGAFVMSVGFGAPTYLTFGTAAFWYGLRRFGSDAPLHSLAFAANLVSAPIVLLFLLATNTSDALSSTAFLVGFGCIAAPIWGAIFGWIYWWFVRIGDDLKQRAADMRGDEPRS